MAHAGGAADVEDVEKELWTPHLLDPGCLSSEAREPGYGFPIGKHQALIDEPPVGVVSVGHGDCVRVGQVNVCTTTGPG